MRTSHSKNVIGDAVQPKRRRLRLDKEWDEMMDVRFTTGSKAAELLDSVPAMLWRSDENGLYTYFNRAWLEFRGRTLEEEKGLGWIEGIHPDDLKTALDIHAEASNEKRVFIRKFRLQGADKEYRWMKDCATPIYVSGAFVGYSGSAMDFTAEHESEEAVRRSLEEKETLLKETHHRIKNNLQILTSLLSLQRQQGGDANVKAILQDCQNRVHVIVLLHQKLFQVQHLDALNFAEYIRELAQIVLDSYRDDRSKIYLKLEIDSLPMHPDKIISCGLVLNELLSNAVKHAFPDKDDGHVTVRLYADKEYYCLEIADSGIGFSNDVPIEEMKTLGLKLVSTLAKQLGGELKLERNAGTIACIRFPR